MLANTTLVSTIEAVSVPSALGSPVAVDGSEGRAVSVPAALGSLVTVDGGERRGHVSKATPHVSLM